MKRSLLPERLVVGKIMILKRQLEATRASNSSNSSNSSDGQGSNIKNGNENDQNDARFIRTRALRLDLGHG